MNGLAKVLGVQVYMVDLVNWIQYYCKRKLCFAGLFTTMCVICSMQESRGDVN